MWTESYATRSYAHLAATTAGHLKAYQLLLERAILLVRRARVGDMAARDRAQDIVAQVQSGLNLGALGAPQLFEVLGYTWDALEWNANVYYDRAEDLLRQVRELVVEIQRMR